MLTQMMMLDIVTARRQAEAQAAAEAEARRNDEYEAHVMHTPSAAGSDAASAGSPFTQQPERTRLRIGLNYSV